MSDHPVYAEQLRQEQADQMASALNMWSPMFVGAATWNGKFYAGIAMLNSEWLEFVSSRLKEDFGLVHRLSACRSPMAAWSEYVGFWQKAIADYQKELLVLSKLTTSFVSNGVCATHSRRMSEAASSTASCATYPRSGSGPALSPYGLPYDWSLWSSFPGAPPSSAESKGASHGKA